MSSIKISDLSEETDFTNNDIYAIGVKKNISDNSLTTVKYNIGNVLNTLSSTVNGIISAKNIDIFDSSRNYYVGQYCTNEDGSKVYRFIKTHFAGPWITDTSLQDWVETSLWEEIQSITTGTFEDITVTIVFEEDSGILNGINITLELEDGTTQVKQTDTNGKCEFSVEKGKKYTVFGEDLEGYIKQIKQQTYTASISHRYINLIYTEGISNQTYTLSVNLDILNNSLDNTVFDGSELMINNNGITTSQTFTNGKLQIENIPINSTVTLSMPFTEGYIVPDPMNVFVIGNQSVDISCNLDHTTGIYYVVGETTKSIEDGTAWGEFLAEDFPFEEDGSYDETKHPCYLIHMATDNLIKQSADYYVIMKALTSSRGSLVSSQQWCSVQGAVHTHVPYDGNTDWNGIKNTYYMKYDSSDMKAYSNAANWVTTQTIIKNNQKFCGYIGSKNQINQLMTAKYKDELYSVIPKFGLTPNFYSGTNWWSSTQSGASYAWLWNSGSYWYNTRYKAGSYTVLPFFAIR